MAAWTIVPFASHDLESEHGQLRAVNERLWDIEDQLRVLEAEGRLDDRFVELARLVYHTDDECAAGANVEGVPGYAAFLPGCACFM
jgi:hypothetical protein